MKFKEWLYNEDFPTSRLRQEPEYIVRRELKRFGFDQFLQPSFNLETVVNRVIQFLNGNDNGGDLSAYLTRFIRPEIKNNTFLSKLQNLATNIEGSIPKTYRPNSNFDLNIDATGEPVQSKFSVKSDEPLPNNVRQAWQNFMAIINKVGEKGLSQPTRESNIAREAYKIIRQADWNIRKNGNGGFELYYFIPPEVQKLYNTFMSSGPNKNNPTAIQALQKLRSIGWDLRQTSDGKLKPGKISRDV